MTDDIATIRELLRPGGAKHGYPQALAALDRVADRLALPDGAVRAARDALVAERERREQAERELEQAQANLALANAAANVAEGERDEAHVLLADVLRSPDFEIDRDEWVGRACAALGETDQ